MKFLLLGLFIASVTITQGYGHYWGHHYENHFDDVSEEVEEEDGMSWEYVYNQMDQVFGSQAVGEEGGSMYDEEKCPCAKPKGASSCAPYNPKYQALTFEEAVSNFRDPVSDPESSKTLIEEVGAEEEEEEDSHSCPHQRKSTEPKRPKKGCCQRFLTHMVRWANGLGDEGMRNKTLREGKRMIKWCNVESETGDFRKTCDARFTSTANDASLKVDLEPVDETDEETLRDIQNIENILKGGVKGGQVMSGCEQFKGRPKRLKGNLRFIF